MDNATSSYESLYTRAVKDLRSCLPQDGVYFYAYDRLALVSVSAFEGVVGWDTSMPFYPSGCDMYERLNMVNYNNPSPNIGQIFDVAVSMQNLSDLYRVGRPGSPTYERLVEYLSSIMDAKIKQGGERNTWQGWQHGGKGEPFYYNPKGMAQSRHELIALGRKIYSLKCGASECRLYNHGRRARDAWHSFPRTWWQWLTSLEACGGAYLRVV
jgi:hypothetical protein